MPLVDLPLAELEHYQGRNPLPDDFDEFWDKGLTEMRSIDPKIELVPHAFKQSVAHCFELRFTGVGGARIFAKLLVPRKIDKLAPAIIGFHGYSANSGDWADKLGYVANGAVVAFMDCRGQGGRSEDVGGVTGTTLNGHIIRGLNGKPEKMLFRQIFLDSAQLADIIMAMPEVDASRVGVTGGSQGGGLTLACAALEPRIKKAAATFPFLCDYLRVWEMDMATNAYAELKSYFRNHDPRHERKEETFRQLGYIDVQHLAPRIRAEVLMATGLMDTITPPSTQFAAFNKIRSPKRNVFYPDFGHEGLPGLNDIIFEFLGEL
jgi:cephalosporin-C deacetylase